MVCFELRRLWSFIIILFSLLYWIECVSLFAMRCLIKSINQSSNFWIIMVACQRPSLKSCACCSFSLASIRMFQKEKDTIKRSLDRMHGVGSLVALDAFSNARRVHSRYPKKKWKYPERREKWNQSYFSFIISVLCYQDILKKNIPNKKYRRLSHFRSKVIARLQETHWDIARVRHFFLSSLVSSRFL